MAKFIFRLQNVLNMKEKLEEQAKNEYSQAILRLHEEEEKLEKLIQKKSYFLQQLHQAMESELHIRKIKELEQAIDVVKLYIEEQKEQIKKAEQEVLAAREKLNEAMQERKIFEKLREKSFEEFKIEENKREQKEVDELVSYRFRANMENG